MAFCFALNAVSQLSNTLPSSGPVGVGTNTPHAGKQLTVNGDVIMLNNIEIDSNLIVDGESLLNGIVRMAAIDTFAGTVADLQILIVDPFGDVTRTTTKSLVYALMQPIDYCGDGDVANPSWFNGLNKIFSPCSQVNVGIGTSSPDFNLDVKGETFTVKLLVGNELGTDTAMINAYAFNHSQRLLQLGKKVGGLAEEIRFFINNDGSIEMTNVGTNPAITINNGSGHAIVVKDNSGEKIAQLQDDGLFRTRSLRVDLAVWADDVFEKSYDLMSLKALKRFIADKGHLPNVPSANHIERNGLDVGDMQRIQMEKIEELTLHLIEMDERMSSMQNQLTDLKKENQTLKTQLKVD